VSIKATIVLGKLDVAMNQMDEKVTNRAQSVAHPDSPFWLLVFGPKLLQRSNKISSGLGSKHTTTSVLEKVGDAHSKVDMAESLMTRIRSF
jgi:hypothetical protein